MKAWKVGGAVRDALLGRASGDTDWVVTGATPEQMVAAGYTPVGRDFPVFLHPTTKEEYALARTERSTAPGYHGFVFHAAPDVTLEEDLQRRDLTINAMAQDDHGALIDPYGGQRDLAARLLRHVSPAFIEDPVRILRVARFAARLGDFSVAPETASLMCDMVANGEVDALVAERVWQEVARGLPCALTIGSANAALRERVVAAVHGGSIRVYSTDDLIGVEVGGAVKNILAIATGVVDGLGLGLNARAALITRGLAEISRLGAALGGRAETFMGLTGMGDLILTCTGDLSRNRRVGLGLAAGKSLQIVVDELGHVAEGVYSAPTVLAQRLPRPRARPRGP